MGNKKNVLIELSHQKVEAVLDNFQTRVTGLNKVEVKERQDKYGLNIIKQTKTFFPIKQFFKQFIGVMAILLWIAGILALIAEMPELAIATWIVVIVNGIFSFIQEYKADQALSSLAKMMPKQVRVIRDNEIELIDATKITIGDIIYLETGNSVPADARLIESNQLFVDNSMLSGETIPLNRTEKVSKLTNPAVSEIPNLIYAGTTVSQGSGKAVVYAIGNETEIGQVTQIAQTIESGTGTLDLQIHKIVKTISIIATIMGLLIFMATKLILKLEWQAGFVFALSILVANIPEGLLPTVNLSLAVGSQRMAKKNALIKKLTSVETLSSATVICTDKTGTLTQNQLMVRKIFTPEGLVEITGDGYQKTGDFKITAKNGKKGVEKFLSAAILCSETDIVESTENKNQWQVIGSPTEGSLLVAASKYGYDIKDVRSKFKLLKMNPFTSERKKMSTYVQNISDQSYDKDARYLFIKGAPNIILADCTMQYKENHVTILSEEEKVQYLKENDNFASQGFRVLAVGYKKIENDQYQEDDMVFLGFAVTYDPPKKEVAEAVANLRTSGIKITIITGDYGLTAAAIGKQVGIIDDEYINLDGVEVEKMTTTELENILKSDQPIVFSRTTPQHKLKIVEAYKKNGEVVAVTGDGVNDILALKSAHIGIAMGKNGTDVARNSADMILLDDNFATISHAVLEGRGIYENIKKFITYVLASNVPQLIPVLMMIFFRIPPALTVLQILLIDLLTDLVPALALGAEIPDVRLLKEKPRNTKENILERKLLLRAYMFLGMIEALLSFGVFILIWYFAGYTFSEISYIGNLVINGQATEHAMNTYHYASTMALGVVIFSQIGNVFACRSEKLNFFETIKKPNKLLYIGILSEIVIFILIIHIPFLQDIFGTTHIKLVDYLILLIMPIIVIGLDLLYKKIVTLKNRGQKVYDK
ncbi:H+ transporting ATPase, P-type ATPase [Alteracholeplasma palmae J233]|uniref:H+ transporting ATPase, P-type ATPase n=1 Tax=Alteracholeplasma palmae (strain ATCC 49389 / J233) TaxID=1318466 RepID=U4KLD6_ALTPJ|nr:cation-transporting P-type ATPase [Alteracholeplasma palmae]CCV64618.1 H+ transporting ATPase, P-type ATPase [Alteracholeplasma palmae J233]